MRRSTQQAIEGFISEAVDQVFERRDPQVGIIRTDYQGPGQPQVPEWDAETAIRHAYIVNTYVYRCVEVIAKSIAGSPFRCGLDAEKRMDWNLQAPLAQFLGPPPGSPNPSLSPRRLWAWTVAQRLVTGRWCWEIETGSTGRRNVSDTIAGLWPVPARYVKPIPAENGREYFTSFEFNAQDPGRRKILPAKQVVYDWVPGQNDVRQAESVLMAARYDISILTMQDRYDYAFLRNDARPATVVVHEEFAEKNEREAFRQQFLAEHRGVDNAGKPIFIEATPGDEEMNRTFHIEQLGLSQKDAEFIARMEAKIDAVCIALGTPLSILGNASGRTFDNAGQEYANWWESTVIPIMNEFEDAINMQLAPRLGNEVGWFDTSHVAALRKQSKIVVLGAAAVQFLEKKVFKINEIRDAYDLEPLSDKELKDIDAAAEAARIAGEAARTQLAAPPEAMGPSRVAGTVHPPLQQAQEPRSVVPQRMKVVSEEGNRLVLERTGT